MSDACIMFSMSRCFRLGDAVLKARKEQRNPVKSICEHENGVHLISGKVSVEGCIHVRYVSISGPSQDECRAISDFEPPANSLAIFIVINLAQKNSID